MAMTFKELGLPGCLSVESPGSSDGRGWFFKPYFFEAFQERGINFCPRESFYSESNADVIRGMHFQIPPHDHQKLVFCLRGRVLDVGVDLRRKSPLFGNAFSITMSRGQAVFLPSGLAHGFCALEPGTVLGYLVDKSYSPSHDRGILWNSFGFTWPTQNPMLSPRDLAFPKFPDFDSPF